MNANPFCVAAAPAWLAADPTYQIPQLLRHLLEVADAVPGLYAELPWLADISVVSLLLERIGKRLPGGAADGEGQEATITEFFAAVSQPVAKLIEALFTSPLLLERRTVHEILGRMAQAAGKEPLARAVVTGVCANFAPRRLDLLRSERPCPRHAIWRISRQQTEMHVRAAAGIKEVFVILVSETATKKVLAFRCTTEPPGAMDAQLALYDALVFPGGGGMYLMQAVAPPNLLLVEGRIPEAVREAATVWGIETRQVAHEESAFLRGCELELGGRTVDEVRLLHILDRVCERSCGYAPFLTKRRVMQYMGWRSLWDGDPVWRCPGLRELLAQVPAVVGADGTIEWQGWHYRDCERDVLRLFALEAVTIRPSPLSEALVAVYWQDSILCCAIADELRHEDGTYRPYWFPYPHLGE